MLGQSLASTLSTGWRKGCYCLLNAIGLVGLVSPLIELIVSILDSFSELDSMSSFRRSPFK